MHTQRRMRRSIRADRLPGRKAPRTPVPAQSGQRSARVMNGKRRDPISCQISARMLGGREMGLGMAEVRGLRGAGAATHYGG